MSVTRRPGPGSLRHLAGTQPRQAAQSGASLRQGDNCCEKQTVERSFPELAACLLVVSCSSSPPEPAAAPAEPAPPAPVTAPAPKPSSNPTTVAPPPPPPDPWAGTSFPPKDFEPPHERSAQEGDGKWVPAAGVASFEGSPIAVETTLRPHPFKRFSFVRVIAVDRKHVQLQLVAGTREPENEDISKEQRRGLVPAEHHARLIAVLNGGFKAKHGGYGMRLGEHEYLPPKSGVCTVALTQSGELKIATWEQLAAESGQLAWWRQGPKCLLEDGEVQPDVTHVVRRRKYGLAADGKFEIRRSAIGLDESGRTLFYAVGEEQTPKLLVEAMQTVGAVDVAQLDVNWSYTRFVFFEEQGGKLRAGRTLLKKMKHSKAGYVEKPSSKDFFYLLAPEGWQR